MFDERVVHRRDSPASGPGPVIMRPQLVANMRAVAAWASAQKSVQVLREYRPSGRRPAISCAQGTVFNPGSGQIAAKHRPARRFDFVMPASNYLSIFRVGPPPHIGLGIRGHARRGQTPAPLRARGLRSVRRAPRVPPPNGGPQSGLIASASAHGCSTRRAQESVAKAPAQGRIASCQRRQLGCLVEPRQRGRGKGVRVLERTSLAVAE